MAESRTPPAAKTLFRLRVGKMSGWLPAVAVFLCLSMFAIAALVLLQVGADPESPPSPVATSVAGQGLAGLRRLLEADGHVTAINRFEDDGPAERGDLEIIALDNPLYLFSMNEAPSDDQDASASSAETVSSEQASAGASASEDAARQANRADYVPEKKRVDHLLYKPLGKAVLVIAPKWDTRAWPKNPRWGQGATLVSADDIDYLLTLLSPVSEKPTAYDDDGRALPVPAIPGKTISIGQEKTYIVDDVDYVVHRAIRPAPPKVTRPNPDHDPLIEMENQPDPDMPVPATVVLNPAPGQALFTAPLQAGRIDGLQSITAPNLVPVLVTADGQPVLSRVIVTDGRPHPKVPVYLLSDPDLLNNLILSQPQKVANALDLVNALIRAGKPAPTARSAPDSKPVSISEALDHTKIIFNMTYNGLSFDRDLLHALSRPPFLAVPLAMLILGLALMWAAFARFGPAQEAAAGPPLGRGVRTLADNAARLMALTLKETKLGPAYAVLMRDMVIRGRGFRQIDPGQGLDDLAERIGRTHGASHSYLDLKDAAARVATVHQLIDVTLKLHAWKTEIERAHI